MEGTGLSAAHGRTDDPFDNLASWQEMSNYVDGMGDSSQGGGVDEHMLPNMLTDSNLSLQRSLSLPAYLSGTSSQSMGGMVPLSRHLGNRANSFGPNTPNLGVGLDANAEISARLVSMLSKVGGHARALEPAAGGERVPFFQRRQLACTRALSPSSSSAGASSLSRRRALSA